MEGSKRGWIRGGGLEKEQCMCVCVCVCVGGGGGGRKGE